MYILRIWPGGVDMSLTAEECLYLAEMLDRAEYGDDRRVGEPMRSAFRAMGDAGLARTFLTKEELGELDGEVASG